MAKQNQNAYARQPSGAIKWFVPLYHEGRPAESNSGLPAKGNGLLETSLHVVHSGIAVAVKKGNDWIPHPDLSLSVDLKQNAFPRLEVTHTEALAFLRKETVICPEGTEKGFVLITFEEYPLGFIKNLGKRSNNLHPASRRILMQQPTNHIS